MENNAKVKVIRAQKKRALERFYPMNLILENQKKIFYILIKPRKPDKIHAISDTTSLGASDGKQC